MALAALAAGPLGPHHLAAAAIAQSDAAPTISAERLMATVRELASESYEGRAAGTPGNAKARAWIRSRFGEAGLAPVGDGFDHPFTAAPASQTGGGAGTPVKGVNLVGRCAGTEPSQPVIVVSAHYDHEGIRNGRLYPGADDNASGVAVLLELARECRERPFRHDLLFVAFDAEENGLLGARAFVADPPVPRNRIGLDVNLDMVARGDKGELFISGVHHRPSLAPILEPVAARAPITVRFGHDLPGSGHDDWTLQSDHGAFHRAGIPFLYFGVEDHPDYHQPTDTPDKIDSRFFADAAQVILDALRALDGHLREAA